MIFFAQERQKNFFKSWEKRKKNKIYQNRIHLIRRCKSVHLVSVYITIFLSSFYDHGSTTFPYILTEWWQCLFFYCKWISTEIVSFSMQSYLCYWVFSILVLAGKESNMVLFSRSFETVFLGSSVWLQPWGNPDVSSPLSAEIIDMSPCLSISIATMKHHDKKASVEYRVIG